MKLKEMNLKQLFRVRREARQELALLKLEKGDISKSPKGLEHWEDTDLKNGYSLREFLERVRRKGGFTRAERGNMSESYEWKQYIQTVNRFIRKERGF